MKKPPNFEELQSYWYDRLKKDGFEDIEQSDGNLKQWSSSMLKHHYNKEKFAAKEEYYRMAGYFLHEYRFKNKTEKRIWELHSEGIGIRDIAKQLKKSKWKIESILSPLIKQMKTQVK